MNLSFPLTIADCFMCYACHERNEDQNRFSCDQEGKVEYGAKLMEISNSYVGAMFMWATCGVVPQGPQKYIFTT